LENLDSSEYIHRAGECTRERISKRLLKNGRSIDSGVMKNVHNLWIKGSRLNCSGYRIEAKSV
jgi:hypothetical protein